MPKSKRSKKRKQKGHLKYSTLRLDRYTTEKKADITDHGQEVGPATKNKFNPPLNAPEYDDVSNNVVQHKLTTGQLAPIEYTRKKRAIKLPGPIGGAG
jgi:hypothetical protein